MVRRSIYQSAIRPISPCRDTVGSVGLLPKQLPSTGSNNAILHFRHALALDEHRVKYIPYYWTKDPEVDGENVHHNIERRQTSEEPEFEGKLDETAEPVTDVKEVFFAGVHCGAFWLLRIHQISYLPMPFQMLGVDLWKMANVPVLPVFPFDG